MTTIYVIFLFNKKLRMDKLLAPAAIDTGVNELSVLPLYFSTSSLKCDSFIHHLTILNEFETNRSEKSFLKLTYTHFLDILKV